MRPAKRSRSDISPAKRLSDPTVPILSLDMVKTPKQCLSKCSLFTAPCGDPENLGRTFSQVYLALSSRPVDCGSQPASCALGLEGSNRSYPEATV